MAGEGSKPRAEASELLEEGRRLAKGGMPEKAIAAYRDVRGHTADVAIQAESWRLEAFAEQALGRWSEALDAARRSEALALELDRPDLVAEALNAQAAVHFGRGDFDQAVRLFESMLELTEEPRIRGLAYQNLGIIEARRANHAAAEERLLAAYGEFDRVGYEWGMAHVLNNRAGVALDQEEYEGAEEVAKSAVVMARKVDDLDLLAVATLNYAEALAGLGDLERAEVHASTALGYFDSAGNQWRRISCYQILGKVHQAQGDMELARRFWTDGLRIARELGASAEAEQLEARLSS